MTLRASARCSAGFYADHRKQGPHSRERLELQLRMRPREQGGTVLDARRMSTSTSTRAFGLASHPHRKSFRKVIPNHVLGTAAVAALVLGCAWNLHANVFGANVYPSMAGGNFDAPVIRRTQSVVARTPQSIVNNV